MVGRLADVLGLNLERIRKTAREIKEGSLVSSRFS
jgi:hypothetical protein